MTIIHQFILKHQLSKIPGSLTYDFLRQEIKYDIKPNQFGFRLEHTTLHYIVLMLDTILKHLQIKKSLAAAVFADI